jgi:uncharacterized protein YcbK (DUF882 family)
LKETTLQFSLLSLSSRIVRLVCAGATLVAGTMLMGQDTQNAIANGDTRTISLYHTHRKDSLNITFKRGGYYDRAALAKLNYFLRDWRNDAQTNMDPRLFDVIWEAYSEVGYNGPVHIVSAYRSPETNAMLRRRSRGVAKHSQHMLGKAMDTTVPGLNMARVRAVGMRLQMGGVGFYPRSNTPFVHLDVGNVRAWPRMSRAQLAQIFPDGRTVHLPAEGGTMPGYQLALADIQRLGRGVGGSEGEDGDGGRSFFSALFGGGTDSGENYPQDNSPLAIAQRDARRSNGEVQVASAAPVVIAQRKARPAVPAEVPKVAAPEVMVEPATLTPTPTPQGKPLPVVEQAEPQIALVAPQSLEPKFDGRTPGSIVPLPPRRPNNLDGLVAVASIGEDANVPMPPLRPGAVMALAMAEPVSLPETGQPAGTDTSGIVPELGPVAVLRPTTTGSAPRPLPEPAAAPRPKLGVPVAPPPLRTAALSAESETPIVRSLALVANPKQQEDALLPELIRDGRAKVNASEQPGPSLALIDVPLPPLRPAAARALVKLASAPVTPAAKSTLTEDEAAPAIRLRPTVKALQLVPKVKTAAVVAGGFSKDKTALAAGSFTGSLVRPLGAKFVKRETSTN